MSHGDVQLTPTAHLIGLSCVVVGLARSHLEHCGEPLLFEGGGVGPGVGRPPICARPRLCREVRPTIRSTVHAWRGSARARTVDLRNQWDD